MPLSPSRPGGAARGVSRRSLIRSTAAGAVLAGGSGLLAACGAGGGPASASGTRPGSPGSFGSIALQLSWIKNFEFWGEYAATEKGYYRQAGFTGVDLLAGGTSTTAESLVLAGKVLLGLSSAPLTAATVVNSNAPLKIIGATYQKNPFAIGSLADGTPVRTPHDMIGRRIGVQAGGNQTLFDGLLKANGIAPSQVEVVGVEYDDSVLTTGKVDGLMTYVNASVGLTLRGHKPVIMGFADNGLPFVAETLTVRQDTIERKRDLLKAFLRAEIEGWTAAVRDPATAAGYEIHKYGKSTAPDFAEEYGQGVVQNAQLVVTEDTNRYGLFTMTDALIRDNMATLRTMGYSLAADDLFDLTLLKEVYREHPALKVPLTPPTAITPPTARKAS